MHAYFSVSIVFTCVHALCSPAYVCMYVSTYYCMWIVSILCVHIFVCVLVMCI